jgi:hypothetical protein
MSTSGCANRLRFGKLLVPILATLIGASDAQACGLSNYNRDQELRAIRKGLAETRLTAKVRAEIEKHLDIASVDPKHLTLAGLAIQENERGDALKKLGIERIPDKPKRDIDAIKAKLATLPPSETKAQAAQLLIGAEGLWSERKYEESRKALQRAAQILDIRLSGLDRC